MPYADRQKQLAAQKKWRDENPDRSHGEELPECKRARMVVWRANNKKHIAASARQYRQANRAKANRRTVLRNRENIQAKLRLNLRKRLTAAIRGGFKGGSAVRSLGCTIPELMAHLEAMWTDGMSWATYGPSGWHIDHVRALSKFDLSDPEQVAIACRYSNLQPLWAADNIAKGGKNRERENRIGNDATRMEMGNQELAPVPVGEV
jgi:hypothetical protein